LPESIEYAALERKILELNNGNLYRLFLEYLPLTFSRRHGDPSRPWNLFDIKVKDDAGNKLLSYQGNWRDIFQNWEALSLSFPGYINGIIAKFVNASTADGYNPYKVTSDGIDWEVIEPENPWSNIGYWGDHQIIYLLKLMEVSRNHYPESLLMMLNKELFAYANVPYRLKSYKEIVAEPKNSIRFDAPLHHSIEKLVPTYGADAKLILNPHGEVLLVSFTEKILATLLAKLSNFIPEAGIWMNTLRPEWNDANNALVGSGASMVTLYYIRRFLAFSIELFQDSKESTFPVSTEMSAFFDNLNKSFFHFSNQLVSGFDDKKRRGLADELGQAGSDYRDSIYKGFSGSKRNLDKTTITDFFTLSLRYIDQSIEVNKRPDNMYHAYNLVSFSDDSITIRNLYEMLEGQVAVLTSGKLSPVETLDLLDSLRNSSLYRPDQESYILYPNKKLPLFLDKNMIPKEEVEGIKLLKDFIDSGDTSIITVDHKGCYHFNAGFKNAGFLTAALNKLKRTSGFKITEGDQKAVEQLYERLFDHQSFTGRSGTFYKYEGLGCIYWHMVSKLLLVVGESIQKAASLHASPEILSRLMHHYAAIQKGIGAHKSPADYGSFPFDPYSHTPMMAGVQQPGMTGQVKEDIISRFFELGVLVQDGKLEIRPLILKREEFIQPALSGKNKFPTLSFTYCSIPFVYLIDGQEGIDIHITDKSSLHVDGYLLTHAQSEGVFKRDKAIKRVIVHFKTVDNINR